MNSSRKAASRILAQGLYERRAKTKVLRAFSHLTNPRRLNQATYSTPHYRAIMRQPSRSFKIFMRSPEQEQKIKVLKKELDQAIDNRNELINTLNDLRAQFVNKQPKRINGTEQQNIQVVKERSKLKEDLQATSLQLEEAEVLLQKTKEQLRIEIYGLLYRLYLCIFNFGKQYFHVPTVGLLIASLYSFSIFLNRMDMKIAERKALQDFMEENEKETNSYVQKAGLQYLEKKEAKQPYGIYFSYEDPRDYQRIGQAMNFIGNESWDLIYKLEKAYKMKKKDQSKAQIIYLYGDPGIGKSTVFAALVYYFQRSETGPLFKEKFPFLANFKNFIMIHPHTIDLEKLDDQKLELAIAQLKRKNYLVVIDDAHKIPLSHRGDKLLNKFTSKIDYLILLGSQSPPKKHQIFKNVDNTQVLTELPHFEAVKQVNRCFQLKNNKLAQVTPPLQAEYFAYRMWFYIGGNLRLLKRDILQLDYFQHSEYYSSTETYYQTKKIDNRDQEEIRSIMKSTQFSNLFSFLTKQLKSPLENIIQINFKTVVKKTSNNEVDQFQEKNILVKKRIYLITATEKDRYNQEIITFHSRRTQYSFSMWILENYYSYWQTSSQRVKFQQLLQRVQYQYILEFELFRLKKYCKIIRMKEESKSQKESKTATSFQILRINPGATFKASLLGESAIQLTEAEITLTMKLYAIFQSHGKEDQTEELEFIPKPIIRDLLKGPEHFYSQYKIIIDEVLKKDQKLKEEIQEQKKKIEELKSRSEGLKLRMDFYTEEAKSYLEELKNKMGFQLQNSLKPDDFEKMEPISEEKYKEAKRQLESSLQGYQKEVALTALDMAVDSHFRMAIETKEFKTREEKIDKEKSK